MHSLYDRTQSVWKGVLARSKGNINTKGSNFEGLLEVDLTAAKELDESLMGILEKNEARITFTDKDIQLAGKLSTDMANKIKEGNKKKQALLSWLRLPTEPSAQPSH